MLIYVKFQIKSYVYIRMSSLQGFFQTSVHGRFRNMRANNTEYTIIIRELPFNTGGGMGGQENLLGEWNFFWAKEGEWFLFRLWKGEFF